MDFRLQQFDMLPDFIGYGMIFYGLQQLAEQDDFFNKAKTPAGLLIFLSLPDFYNANATNGLVEDRYALSAVFSRSGC
ncbi:MAG: hypothetical protein QMC95_16735 [Desulfitobacteriaceae bacterium]|nr:hypothetical protein [Desulfitobacteriaceae bacterium]MDI6915836.1 hypothetical protein [Desulfitobacteriaceae bacterium]